jgi:hypothetical protein
LAAAGVIAVVSPTPAYPVIVAAADGFLREGMTQAVCFACGEIKMGAFNVCGSCRQRPVAEGSLILSLAMTDHYFDTPVLMRMGENVKLGKLPILDDQTKARLLPQVQRIKEMLGLGSGTKKKDSFHRTSPKHRSVNWWPFRRNR